MCRAVILLGTLVLILLNNVDKNISNGLNVYEPSTSNSGTYSTKVQYENWET